MSEDLIAWCGFFGAWLLVAGPVFQASLELREQEFERERVNVAAHDIPQPPAVSAWWWLVPPVKYVLERKRSRVFRDQVMAHLDRADVEALVRYINKATGWMFVGFGGFLIALTETWHLVEVYEWPQFVFWVLLVVMSFFCLLNTVLRQKRGEDMLT